MDDSNEDVRKHQQLCMQLIFQLISHVLQLSQDNENISLDAITPRLYELICDWLDSEHCGVAAIELLTSLMQLGKRGAVSQLIAREPANVVKLVNSSERSDAMHAAHTTAILRLLLALLHEPKTEKLVLSKISDSYFDKILAAPLGLLPQMLSAQTLAQSEVEKSVYCLLLLIGFASIAKKAYLDKCCALLELPQLQYALARAMLSGSEQLVQAVLQIAQFEHFPKAAVAKVRNTFPPPYSPTTPSTSTSALSSPTATDLPPTTLASASSNRTTTTILPSTPIPSSSISTPTSTPIPAPPLLFQLSLIS